MVAIVLVVVVAPAVVLNIPLLNVFALVDMMASNVIDSYVKVISTSVCGLLINAALLPPPLYSFFPSQLLPGYPLPGPLLLLAVYPPSPHPRRQRQDLH